MNKETYEALKRTMHHTEYGGPNDKAFWDDFKIVESWIDEVSKEYEEEDTGNIICECGARFWGWEDKEDTCPKCLKELITHNG